MIGGKKKLLGWLISAVFLALVFTSVDWHEFAASFSRLGAGDIAVLCGIYLIGFLARGLRSKVLLPGLSARAALGGVFVGYAANNLLPARLGEVVRAHVVGRYAGIKRTTAFSSVIVERIFDGSAIVFLLILGAGPLTLPPWAENVRLSGLILFSIALLCVLATGRSERWISQQLPRTKLADNLRGLIAGIALAVRSVPAFVLITGGSVLIWTIESAMFYYGFRAFGFELSFLAAAFVMAVVNLGVLIPSSPGGLGVFQYFCVLALEFLDIKHAEATAYAVTVHLCQYVPVTIIGSLWLPRFGVRTMSAEAIAELDRSNESETQSD